MRRSISAYPADWPVIAYRIKCEADWKCVRCGADNDRFTGHVLTVHHLDMDPQNCAWWNCPALCQKCHLTIQAKVFMDRQWMFEHTPWFRPYVAGYYAHVHGQPTDRDWVIEHIEMLLDYGRPQS